MPPAYIPVRSRPLRVVHLVQTADDHPFLSTQARRALCGYYSSLWDRAARAEVTCWRCVAARDRAAAR